MDKKCYVYVLMDPSVKMEWEYNGVKYYYEPFYIGMGSGYRINFHGSKKDLKCDKNTLKRDCMLKINRLGLKIKKEKLIENLTPSEACSIEIELMKRFGRLINNDGILTNISKGGELFSYGSDHPSATVVYQYSKEGLFIKKYETLCDIKIPGRSDYVKNGVSNCSRNNAKNFPKKIHTYHDFIWLKDYKGVDIKSIINENDKRIYQYSEKFKLLNIYKGGVELEKNAYSDSSVYYAISNKHMYRNSYWSKGKILDTNLYSEKIRNCKKCFQYSIDGIFIKQHDCVTDIPKKEELDITSGSISDACTINSLHYPTKRYTASGFVWMYTYEGETLEKIDTPIESKIHQWDFQFNVIDNFDTYKSIDSKFNRLGIKKAIDKKRSYKNYYWTIGDTIDKDLYKVNFKKYYQMSSEGVILNEYNKRSDIPDEFDKNSVGNACSKGHKYKNYYWKNY